MRKVGHSLISRQSNGCPDGWAEPALNDLDAIADYIALDNPEAARRLMQKIFEHVDHLENHPRLGSKPEELKGWRYRQIVEPPCPIFYVDR